MKPCSHLLCFALFATFAVSLLFSGCASTPTTGAVTDRQATIAAAVEDTLSIGLVPVLTKNSDYVPQARAVAAALATVTGESLTPGDVEAFLAGTSIAPADQRTIAGLVNAAWDTYARRYAAQVGAQIRPDVRLFLSAVSNGITRAVAALPQAAQPAAAS